jgi:hypothetical protein
MTHRSLRKMNITKSSCLNATRAIQKVLSGQLLTKQREENVLYIKINTNLS